MDDASTYIYRMKHNNKPYTINTSGKDKQIVGFVAVSQTFSNAGIYNLKDDFICKNSRGDRYMFSDGSVTRIVNYSGKVIANFRGKKVRDVVDLNGYLAVYTSENKRVNNNTGYVYYRIYIMDRAGKNKKCISTSKRVS